MGNQFNEIMQKLRAQRVRARRYTAMLLVLAMLTSLSVSWRLHQVGTALTTDNEYSCGMEEHVHTDDCYTEELVCGYEEGQPEDPDSAFSVDSEPTTEEPEAEPEEPEPEETEPEVHHHTADCYETVLVEHKELTCGQEEHTHDDTCPVDPDTGDFLCGYEEHTHTDDCYTTETETEEKLICGYEEGEVLSDGTAADEDGIAALEDTNTATSVAEDSSSEAVSEPVLHHHTEACYEKVLTCTIPEHTHTLACLADYSADVETDDDWEKYSVGLSDNWNEALLAVAKEQLGYKESEKNFQTDEALGDIIDVHHYTRYGAFYGNPYADWDVAFIAFCQHYTGIPKTEIPQRLGLEALRADMDAMGFAYLTEGEDAAYEAIPGDVVTYNKNGTADDETIGIVETVGDDSLTVISGAVEGAVAEVTVPFTDVTSTILVDQAYGDYVGEADDRDGSYDDEIAVQPADEKAAVAVYASEGDIFNTDPPAVNLNDSDVQKSLGLTFTFQKRVGDDYVNANLGETIEEGDDVQVVVGFKAPAGTFKTGQNGNKAYYNLPYKLAEPLSNKDITDDSGKKIGRMDVNTDGLVVITFSDNVADFNYKEYFEGTFKVWGKAFAKDDSTSDTITFPGHGNSFTLKKKSDISIHKDVDSKIIFEKGRTYFKYTIKVDSTNGTAGETVTIKDNIKNLWNVTGQFDQASFKLTKNGADAAIPVGYPKIETKSDGTSNFTIEGLEALQARENYTLTYLYEITNANTLKETGSVENSATASYGNNTTNPAGTWKQIMSPKLSVKKEGVYGGNNSDTVMTGRVLWTITVDNPSGRDLNGFKVTDTVKTEGVIILDQNDVKGNIIQIKDGNNNEVDKIVDGVAKKGGTAKVSDDKRSFEYTFPANSTSTKYTFTYCTTVPFDALNNSAGSVQVLNEVDIDKDSEHYHGDGSANVSKREALLLKVPLGGTELEADNNRLKTVWELVIRSDASADTAKKFTIRDYFKNPTNQSNQTMDHYADKSKLEEELTAVGSKNNEKGLFFDVLVNGAYRRVYGIEAMKALGADVTIHYYKDEDSTQEAGGNTDKVKSFTITVDWSGRTVGTPLSVVQIHAKGYTTYVDSADSLKSGEKLSIYNYIKMGDNEKNAKSDYEKPTKKTPNLGKLVSTNEWTGFKDSADIDYTGENTLIWYKLLLKNLDANEATVKDTLPAGLEYTGKYYVGWSTAETEGRNSTDKLLPFVTGGKNEGADNIQYLETPTVTGTADAGQELVFKLKDLNTLKNPKEGSYQIAIIFSVKVTDDYWDDISENPTKKYPNEATWNKSDKIAKADAFVTRKNSYVEKKNDYVEGSKKEVTYTVEINKEGKTLLSTAGKKLVLHDVLTVPSKISAEIDLQSIKLYNDAGNDVTTRMKCKPDEVVDDGTNKTYKITVEVPDGAHYTLKYTYKFIVPDNVAYGAQYQIKNTVDMFGNSETPSDLVYKHSGAAGSVTQDNTNTLKVYKVETDKFYNTLPGATFKLTHWDGSKWSEADGNYTTDADGQILFRYTDQVKENIVNVNRGVLYKLEETAAPNGYIGDSTPHYFLMLSANQTKEDAYAAVSNAEVAEANIRFVAANKTELMHVENTAKQITIRKVWQDANGKQENGSHEPITVKITRYKDGKVDTAWLPKSITLSSDNDWTYIYPDSSKSDDPLEDGCTYAVEEESVPSGYNVSYTDSKGTERHTGLTSGDSVTITNMKKTNWLIVEKKWLAEGGTTTLTDLPEGTSITLKLYEVGGKTDPVATKILAKDDSSNWKWKVTNLNPSAKYYVVEEPTVKGFEVSYSHSVTSPASPGDTVIVTNTQKSTKTTLEVVKKWLNTDGMELKDNLPVGGIIVQLYKLNVGTGELEKVGGKTLPLNESNGWTGTFTDLEPDGQYTVKEVSVPDGYTVSYSVNEDEAVVPGATITVTNRKNAPGYELPATGSTGTAPYTTAGAVLMGAALVGGYRRKRRQERRGE